MSETKYTHNPETLKDDLAFVEKWKGTTNMDCDAYYSGLDNILRFAKWCHLGTDGKLNSDIDKEFTSKHEKGFTGSIPSGLEFCNGMIYGTIKKAGNKED